MLLLKFNTDQEIENFAGMIDVAQNILDPKAAKTVGNHDFTEYVNRVKKEVMYAKETPKKILHIRRPSDVIFLLENLLWILKNIPHKIKFKNEPDPEWMKQLMEGQLEEAIGILRTSSNEPAKQGSRLFFPNLEKIFKKHIGDYVRFENELDIKRIFGTENIPARPGIGELWTILEYKKADIDSEEEMEDMLLLEKKGGKGKILLPVSEVYKVTSLLKK